MNTKLLEQQITINEQASEIAALRKVLGECYRRFEFIGVDKKSQVMKHIRAVLPAGEEYGKKTN